MKKGTKMVQKLFMRRAAIIVMMLSITFMCACSTTGISSHETDVTEPAVVTEPVKEIIKDISNTVDSMAPCQVQVDGVVYTFEDEKIDNPEMYMTEENYLGKVEKMTSGSKAVSEDFASNFLDAGSELYRVSEDVILIRYTLNGQQLLRIARRLK